MAKHLHILLVDDTDFIQQVIGTMLTKLGHTYQIADNGQVALACLQSGQVYDLVLMDVKMPVMDGLAATRKMRSLGMSLPVIGISGDTDAEDQQACFDAGMNGFIKKPPTLTMLQAEFDKNLF